MRDWHPLTKFVLVVGVLATGWLLWTDHDAGRSEAAIVEPQRGGERGLAEPILRIELPQRPDYAELPPPRAFHAMVERPLLSATRRPFEEPEQVEIVAVEEEPPAFEPEIEQLPEPDILLVGTVRQDGDLVALVNELGTIGIDRLRLGDELQGWQVVSIEERALTLAYEAETRHFSILD